MPEQYQEIVNATQLRPGDLIDGEFRVDKTSIKQKYVHVTIIGEDGKVGRYERQQMFTVTRTRPTSEEADAEALASALFAIDNDERHARVRLVSAQQKIVKMVSDGVHVSWHHIEDLQQSQAIVAIWDRVRHIHLHRSQEMAMAAPVLDNLTAETISELEPPTRIEVIQIVKRRLLKEIITTSNIGSHGSTSNAANLEAAYAFDAAKRWLQDRDYDVNLVTGDTIY